MNLKSILLLTFTALFISFLNISAGYKKNVEALQNKLVIATDDERINILDSLFIYSIRFDENLAEKYLSELKIYSEKIENSKGKLLSQINLVTFLITKNLLDSAMKVVVPALKKAVELNDKRLLAKVHLEIGRLNGFLGNLDQSFASYSEALKIYEELDDKILISTIHTNYAINYYVLNNLDKSQEYLYKAFNSYKKENNLNGILYVYSLMGNIKFVQNKIDSALYYYNLAKDLAIKLDDLNNLRLIDINLLFIDYGKRNFNEIVKKVNSFKETEKSKGYLAYLDYILGFTYYEMGNYKKAIEVLLKSERYYDSLKMLISLKNCTEYLAFSYEKIGDYKNSNKYFKDLITIKDSIYTNSLLQRLKNIEMQKDLAIINNEKELSEQKNRYYLIVLIILIAGFTIIFIIFTYKFLDTKKINRLLQESISQISEREKQLQILNNENEKFKIIFDLSPSLLVLVGLDGNILYANKKFCETLEYSPEEIINMTVSKLRLEDEKDLAKKDIGMLDNNQIREHEVVNITKTGKKKNMLLREGLFTLPDKTQVIIVGALDITERKILERLRDESVKNLRAIVSSLDDIVLEIDENFFITNIWTSNENILETHLSNLFNKKLTELPYLTLDSTKIENIKNVFENKQSYYFEEKINFQKMELWVSFKINPINYNFEKTRRASVLVRNITERKKNEEKLIKLNKELSESNRSKDKLFSIIAHDLKSPFQGLLGITEILKDNYDLLPEGKKKRYISLLYDASQNTVELVENLLAWSRLQTGRMEFNPITLNLLEEVNSVFGQLNILAQNKNIKLMTDISSDLTIKADKQILQTILRNLINNAIKFTNANGSVKVLVKYNNNELQMAVCDNGIGIDKDKLQKIFSFDPDILRVGTNAEKGTGLGLVICKEMVDLHNGKIWVESEINKGTCFYFTLNA